MTADLRSNYAGQGASSAARATFFMSADRPVRASRQKFPGRKSQPPFALEEQSKPITDVVVGFSIGVQPI